MATFSAYQDQDNNSCLLPNKSKDAVPSRKRTVLMLLNTNSEDGNEVKLPVHKDVPSKKTAFVKHEDDNISFHSDKQYFKIFQENLGQLSHRDASNEKTAMKDENRNRVLKDKYVEQEKPSSPKEITFPSFVTLLHREPSVSSSSSCISIRETFPDVPMTVDNSKMDSFLNLDHDSRANKLYMSERLYACNEYRSEISAYLRLLQREHRPITNYMLQQPYISYGMRAILVDWLVEVVEEYHMTTETLYLAVSYTDRFLSYVSIDQTKLQLVGIAAMFIASKFEEINPPNASDFVYITDNTYSKKQLLRMEHLILKVLSFDLSTPTILCFLTDFTANYPTMEKVKNLAMYLCELTLLEADTYLTFLPSEIAASALIVARYTLLDEVEEDVFPDDLRETVDYRIDDLIDCISALDNTFRKTSSISQKVIQEKYKSNKFRNVASIECLDEDCSFILYHKIL